MTPSTLKATPPPQRASRTAELVAVSRARHLIRHAPPYVFRDHFAHIFLGRTWHTILGSKVLDALFAGVVLRRLMPITTQHLVRARFAEAMLENATQHGVSQYVLLGAGFDTFALRRPELGLRVFEVERPATIERKRERMRKAGVAESAGMKFVPFDFEHGNLDDALNAAGYERTAPAFFNWMGVSYYLTPRAIIETVRRLAALTAPGSELVFDYLIAECCVLKHDRKLFDSMMRFVSKRGEPMITRFDPALAPQTFNADNSWRIISNTSPARQAELYLGTRSDLPPLAPITWFLHLARK